MELPRKSVASHLLLAIILDQSRGVDARGWFVSGENASNKSDQLLCDSWRIVNSELLAMGLLWYVVFLLSLTCHEAAHALVAKIGGDLTAFRGGQASLNPLPHMRREPLGTIIVPILSFLLGGWMMGWGSAPYDPAWKHRYPRRAAWTALAGPLANIALLVIAAVAIRLSIYTGTLSPPQSARFTHVVAGSSAGLADGLATLLSVLFSLNLILATFNLLPIPPLDGNTAVGLLLSEEGARRFAALSRNQSFRFVGLLVAWRMFGYIFRPMFGIALRALYPGMGYQ